MSVPQLQNLKCAAVSVLPLITFPSTECRCNIFCECDFMWRLRDNRFILKGSQRNQSFLWDADGGA